MELLSLAENSNKTILDKAFDLVTKLHLENARNYKVRIQLG